MTKGHVTRMDTSPLVSIGLPTYNRAKTLQRTLESVAAQDYPHWEVLISDNASSDETEAVCADFCRQDTRIRCIRQPQNIGAQSNFNFVLQHSSGQYFLWLGDDDWLCPEFLSRCVPALEQDPHCALALGRVHYYQGDHLAFTEPETALCQASGSARVLAYYAHVTENGLMYGLMRRSLLTPALMPRNVIGSDWLFVAALVFQGRVRVQEETCVNRSLGGISRDRRRMAVTLGFSPMQANHPYLCIAGFAFQEIAWASPAYAPLNKRARLRLAARCAALIWRRHSFRFYSAALVKRVAPTGMYNRLRAVYRKAARLDPGGNS